MNYFFKDKLYSTRDNVLGFLYRNLLKRIFFLFDAEKVHNIFRKIGIVLGRSRPLLFLTRAIFGYEHKMLQTDVLGIRFKNPIGLSAGFDKEGELVNIINSVGFGFEEIGSITGSPSTGNPKPRLWRLPKSQSLVVRLGLNSSGSEIIAKQLSEQKHAGPIFLSLAKANNPKFDEIQPGIGDYQLAANNLFGLGDAVVINISCPNTSGGEPFKQKNNLEQLLHHLKNTITTKPTFIKLPVDIDNEELNGIIDVCLKKGISGFICTNLTKRRNPAKIVDKFVPPHGGISGKVLEEDANRVLRYVYRKTDGKVPLIGVGGVFTASDAYEKIRAGASLVSLVTGLIFRGPGVVSEIKRGLVKLLENDGFESISDAVGTDPKISFSTK